MSNISNPKSNVLFQASIIKIMRDSKTAGMQTRGGGVNNKMPTSIKIIQHNKDKDEVPCVIAHFGHINILSARINPIKAVLHRSDPKYVLVKLLDHSIWTVGMIRLFYIKFRNEQDAKQFLDIYNIEAKKLDVAKDDNGGSSLLKSTCEQFSHLQVLEEEGGAAEDVVATAPEEEDEEETTRKAECAQCGNQGLSGEECDNCEIPMIPVVFKNGCDKEEDKKKIKIRGSKKQEQQDRENDHSEDKKKSFYYNNKYATTTGKVGNVSAGTTDAPIMNITTAATGSNTTNKNKKDQQQDEEEEQEEKYDDSIGSKKNNKKGNKLLPVPTVDNHHQKEDEDADHAGEEPNKNNNIISSNDAEDFFSDFEAATPMWPHAPYYPNTRYQ